MTPGLQNALTLQPILSPHLQNASLKEWFMIFIDRHKHRRFVFLERFTKCVAVVNAFFYLNKIFCKRVTKSVGVNKMRRYRQLILTPDLQNVLTLQLMLSPHLRNALMLQPFLSSRFQNSMTQQSILSPRL